MSKVIKYDVLKRPIIQTTQVKKFQAVLPATMGNSVYTKPVGVKFLRLKADNKKLYFRLATEQAGSNHLTIHPYWTGVAEKEHTFEPCSWRAYYWYKCRRDRDDRLLIAGLLITVTAIILDALLALGKLKGDWTIAGLHFPRIVSEGTIAMITTLSFALKITGPALLFWKAARDA